MYVLLKCEILYNTLWLLQLRDYPYYTNFMNAVGANL